MWIGEREREIERGKKGVFMWLYVEKTLRQRSEVRVLRPGGLGTQRSELHVDALHLIHALTHIRTMSPEINLDSFSRYNLGYSR